MKFVTFAVDTPLGPLSRVGALIKDHVVDLAAAYEALLASQGVFAARDLAEATIPSDMREFLGRWPLALNAAKEGLAFCERASAKASPSGARLGYGSGEYRLQVPVRPMRIKDYLTFEEHKRKGFAKLGLKMPEVWYKNPTYTNRNVLGIAGPDEEIAWPAYTNKFDCEFEIGVVIGRAGRNVSAADSGKYIAGFTIYNDLSARDTQQEERDAGSGPGKSKDFDQGNVLGPCIVTPDELDPSNIDMILRVDGEEWSRGNTREMKFNWGQIIEHASREETMFPGDVFASGTMNNGCCLELDRWFKPGSVIEMEARGIGVLRSRIGLRNA